MTNSSSSTSHVLRSGFVPLPLKETQMPRPIDYTWKNNNDVHTLQIETAMFDVTFEIAKGGKGYQAKVNGRLLSQYFERADFVKAWLLNNAIKDIGRLDAALEGALHHLES